MILLHGSNLESFNIKAINDNDVWAELLDSHFLEDIYTSTAQDLTNNLDFNLNSNIWEVHERRWRDRSVLGNDEDGRFEAMLDEPADIEDATATLPTRNRCKVVDDMLATVRSRETARGQRITWRFSASDSKSYWREELFQYVRETKEADIEQGGGPQFRVAD